MADELQGGLNSVNQSEESITPAVKETSEEALYKGDATERLRKQRLAYDQHLQKMIESFKGRTANLGYDPKLLAMSRGFLTPGKTGNFFESLGTAFGGYNEAAQEEQKLKLEDELNKEKLLSLQLGQTEKDYALEKELQGKKYLQDALTGKLSKTGEPITVARTGTKLSVPDAYSIIREAQDPQSGVMVTDAMIVAAPTKETRDILEKIQDNQQKRVETEQKEFGPATRLVYGEEMKLNVEQARNLKKLEDKTLDLVKEGKITSEIRDQLIDQFLIDQKIVRGKTTKTSEGTTKQEIETPLDIAQKRKVEEIQSTEDIRTAKEVQKKDLGEITKVTDAAKTQLVSGNEMFKYADDPKMKQIFGILQKGGYLNAFLTALREPITIVTPSGPLSIGVGNIEEILRVANVKDPTLLETAQKFKSLSKQVETNMTRILLGGEGQITEGERAIVRDIVPTLSDSPKVVQAKAELLIARSQFDIERAKAFEAYIRKNKNATRFEFENNPDSPYQKLWYDYQKHTAEISDAYRNDGKKTPIGVVGETKSTKPSRSSLWDTLKEQQGNQ